MSDYIVSRNLINPHQQAFVNIKDDSVLSTLFTSTTANTATSGSGTSKASGAGAGAGARGEVHVPEFVKRDALVAQVMAKMQPWHRVEVDGREPYIK